MPGFSHPTDGPKKRNHWVGQGVDPAPHKDDTPEFDNVGISNHLAVALEVTVDQQFSETPEELLARAAQATEQGKLDEALNLYRTLMTLAPDLELARNNLGCLLLEVQRTGEAVEVLDVETDSPELRSNLGYALLSHGDLSRAEDVFETLLSENPEDNDARNHLGMVYLRQKLHFEATEMFTRVVREAPGNIQAWNNLGCAQQVLGELPIAAESFRRALQKDPYNVDAHNNLGCILRDLGQVEDAVEELTLAVDLEPRNPSIHLNLALCYRQLGDTRKALTHVRQYLGLAAADSDTSTGRTLLKEVEEQIRQEHDHSEGST